MASAVGEECLVVSWMKVGEQDRCGGGSVEPVVDGGVTGVDDESRSFVAVRYGKARSASAAFKIDFCLAANAASTAKQWDTMRIASANKFDSHSW